MFLIIIIQNGSTHSKNNYNWLIIYDTKIILLIKMREHNIKGSDPLLCYIFVIYNLYKLIYLNNILSYLTYCDLIGYIFIH